MSVSGVPNHERWGIGYKSDRVHGLQSLSPQITHVILYSQVFFDQTSQFEGSEVDIPEAVVNLFKADVVADTAGGNRNIAFVPSDTSV